MSDQDMDSSHLTNKSQIQFLFDSMKNYVRTFTHENGNEIIHTRD